MTAPASPPSTDIRPWLVLPLRLVLFAAIQALLAAVLGGWDRSVAWWPLVAVLANLVVIGLLIALFWREGRSYWALFRVDPAELRQDWSALLAIIVAIIVLAIGPGILLGGLLFGDGQIAQDLLVRPLPLWAAIAAIGFPLSIVFAELPLYFAYAMPRIEAQTGRRWLAIALPSLFLAAQHATLPLIFDGRFILWRGLEFLPLALLLGVVLNRRPKLLPFLVIVHGLLDLSAVALLFTRLG